MDFLTNLQAHMPSLLLAWSIHAFALASPGPNVLAVIGAAMASGRRNALTMSLGIGAGTLLWASMTVAGLTAVIAAYANLLTVIKLLGAAYLLFLAVRAFRNAATANGDLGIAPVVGTRLDLFRRGFILQMSNPKAALSWIAIVSLGLGGTAPLPVAVVFIAGAVVNSTVIHILYGLAFSTAPVVAGYRRLRRLIEASLGMFFTFAAYKLATSRS